METNAKHLPPDIWMQRIFDTKAAREGAVVRRSLSDVNAIVGRVAFEREVRRRGYRALINGDQVIILCNRAPVRVWV